MKYTGVYWMGPVLDMGGYGNVSRNFIKTLETMNIPVQIHPIGPDHAEIGEQTKQWLQRLSTPKIGDRVVFIRHGLPPLFREHFHVPNVARQIGVTLFETDRLPSGWAAEANLMDEIWVPSRFNYETFSRSGVNPSKLKIVPYPIDVTKYYPGKPYQQLIFSPPIRSFVFLYVFGFDYRKGYQMLIQAFCEEFSPAEDVSLILKVYLHSGYKRGFAAKEILSLIPPGRYKNQIVLITTPFSEENLINLYQSSDVYISMDRASGWGMPAMEMMSLGKPVISINWGGATEFMNESNSFLIETEKNLVPVDEKLQRERPDYYLNHHWADVSVANVRKTMREAYENKSKREALARKAASDIHLNFSPASIGMIISRLFS